jgi:hypothetical protein
VEAHADAAEVFWTATRPFAAALQGSGHQQRISLQRLDQALRDVGGLEPRPYQVDDTPSAGQHLQYDGPPLTAGEEDAVRAYIDGRSRGASPPPCRPSWPSHGQHHPRYDHGTIARRVRRTFAP